MRYRLLGNSGLRVSGAALGTMTFGEAWGWGASKRTVKRILERYAEAGGNFLDTANLYTDGESETLLGDFLKANRHHFVLGSKYSLGPLEGGDLNWSGNHRKSLELSLKGSLERLQTDYLDVLWLHAWDGVSPIEGVMRALDDVVRSGRVLHIAVSNTPAWVIARANTLAELRGWTPFCATQVEYSLLERSAERDLIPMADHLGLTTTAWSPLASGILSGKYTRSEGKGRLPGGHARLNQHNLKIARAVDNLASKLGRSSSQVALAWVASQNIIPILGARTLEQLEDNLGYLKLELSERDLQRLEAASPLELGYPHQGLKSGGSRGRLFGGMRDQLDA
jgi:aryl-alcohol dehydrogenase-like predicted oxidoreductase